MVHRDATCTRGEEIPKILQENWKAYTQRVKPIIKTMRKEVIKEAGQEKEQKILLQERLINSNAEMMASNTETMKSFFFQNLRKRELSPSVHHSSSRPAKLTKPAKVPSWTKDMSLETYVKQLTTWQ